MSIRRNSLYNLGGTLVPLALSLVTIPLYLGLIGEARYGVLAIAWLLLGYFGLFDLGLGRATAQRIAALRDAGPAERAQAFWTALFLNVGVGAVGALLIWPVADYFFTHVFKMDAALRPEVQAAVPWLALAVPMATFSGVLTGALQAREKFLELNVVSTLGTVLFQLLPLLAAMYWGAGLDVLLPAALSARLVTLLMLAERCRKHVFAGHAATFDRSQARQLLGLGGWITVTSLVSPIMVTLDRFLIGSISGARAVTYYTVPYQLGERTTILANALSNALFPRLAAAAEPEQQRLAEMGLRILVVVMTPLVAMGILLVEPFLAWWITPGFSEQAGPSGKVLLMAFWINGLAFIPYIQLQARGRPDLVAKCHLAEVLPYVALMYLALAAWGMLGAASVFALRVSVDFVLLARLGGMLGRSVRLLLLPVLWLTAALVSSTLVKPSDSLWIPLFLANLLVTGAWAWRTARPMVAQQMGGSWRWLS